MTTIVRAADAAEFLSFVPRMLGFLPRRSLVVVPFDGTRSLGAMRFDLPPDGEEVDRIAATVTGMVCRVADADALALVVYADANEDRMPHDALVSALESRADACGLDVVDALWVGETEWGAYRAMAEPRPRDEIERVDRTDIALPEGDQFTGATLPEAEDDHRDAVQRAVDGFADAVSIVCGAGSADRPTPDARVDPLALAAVCTLDDLPTLFEKTLTWDATALAPYDVACLAWCLARPALRDIALVQWCRGLSAGDDALDAQLRWEDGEEYPSDLAMQMWGEGDPPDVPRLRDALELVRHGAAAVPERCRPGLLATAAWISWALGRSTHAERYAAQAVAIEPEHGLAEIVLSFVAAGHLPDWAFRGTR